MPTDDEKFGETLREEFAGKDSLNPIRVAVIKHRNKLWLDIRRMWYNKGNFMQFGKGVRLELDNKATMDALLCAEALIGEFTAKEQ